MSHDNRTCVTHSCLTILDLITVKCDRKQRIIIRTLAKCFIEMHWGIVWGKDEKRLEVGQWYCRMMRIQNYIKRGFNYTVSTVLEEGEERGFTLIFSLITNDLKQPCEERFCTVLLCIIWLNTAGTMEWNKAFSYRNAWHFCMPHCAGNYGIFSVFQKGLYPGVFNVWEFCISIQLSGVFVFVGI